MYQKHSLDVEIETKKANVKYKVAYKTFLKLSLLYVKKVGPHHFYSRKSGPRRKKFGHPWPTINFLVMCPKDMKKLPLVNESSPGQYLLLVVIECGR